MKGRFVYNEKGFLLLEHLLALAIIGILSIVLVYLLQVISVYHIDQNALTHHEINTLGLRLQNEVQFATSVSAAPNQFLIHFDHNDEVVSFSVRNDRLLRQVNGTGGEIATYHIRSLDVTLFGDQAARLQLTSLEGERFNIYVSTLRFYVDVGGDTDEE